MLYLDYPCYKTCYNLVPLKAGIFLKKFRERALLLPFLRLTETLYISIQINHDHNIIILMELNLQKTMVWNSSRFFNFYLESVPKPLSENESEKCTFRGFISFHINLDFM